jgi:hypothetical protein
MDSHGDNFPDENGDGRKSSLVTVRGDGGGEFSPHGDGDGEPFPNGEFSIAIPIYDPAQYCNM